MPKIEIDYPKCLALAEHIRASGGTPPDREDPMPHTFPAVVAVNGWCAIVGINHQTTPVVGPALRGSVNGNVLRGWDYLLQKAILEANRRPELFTVPWFRQVTADELRDIFRDEREGDTLNRPEGRAELLLDFGEFLAARGWESIHSLYLASGGYLVKNDGSGIAQAMTQIRAYADPVQKKLFYFLAIMRNQGFWEYQDAFNLSSPVNYHEQRGHFRLGTVRITDGALEAKVRARENITPDEDIEIRFAVRHAIEFISRAMNLTPPMMHYFFWNYFRNCCARDKVHCADCGEGCKLPERYRLKAATRCVLAPACKSAGLPVAQMLIEPRLDDTIWQ